MRHQRLPFSLALVILSLLCVALAGCSGGTKVTVENYDKIQNGMTLKEVEAILGPAGEDATDGVLLAAQKQAKLPDSTKWKKWQAPGNEIRLIGVAFDDGKVVSKAKMGL